ncbi:MAG TPA: hypothetical protein VHM65_03640, partial [Candidatus Lustribacter sp.]|nr:hypothetical protein [Candidatus Lustribacter sp.]
VPVGATLGRFAQALGRTPTPMSAMEEATFTERRCAFRRLDGLPGVAFMVIDDDPVGTVRVIGVGERSDMSTDTGIRLGDHLDEVRAIYGQGLNEPFDHYPVGGQAVLVRADATSGVYWAFIGDQGDLVVDFRLGLKPEVLSPEGCS